MSPPLERTSLNLYILLFYIQKLYIFSNKTNHPFIQQKILKSRATFCIYSLSVDWCWIYRSLMSLKENLKAQFVNPDLVISWVSSCVEHTRNQSIGFMVVPMRLLFWTQECLYPAVLITTVSGSSSWIHKDNPGKWITIPSPTLVSLEDG